jgi:hypothetical protein
MTPGGSFDPHVYIDAIGVPQGVLNEFKAKYQVTAGFKSGGPQLIKMYIDQLYLI